MSKSWFIIGTVLFLIGLVLLIFQIFSSIIPALVIMILGLIIAAISWFKGEAPKQQNNTYLNMPRR